MKHQSILPKYICLYISYFKLFSNPATPSLQPQSPSVNFSTLLNIDETKTKQCFPSISDSPNLSIGPPAYLSVNNFELCLREHQASPNHVEWCLPQNKPEKCLNGSWSELTNVFRGIGCPPIKVAINAGTYLHVNFDKVCF